jgi:hypothetical protein
MIKVIFAICVLAAIGASGELIPRPSVQSAIGQLSFQNVLFNPHLINYSPKILLFSSPKTQFKTLRYKLPVDHIRIEGLQIHESFLNSWNQALAAKFGSSVYLYAVGTLADFVIVLDNTFVSNVIDDIDTYGFKVTLTAKTGDSVDIHLYNQQPVTYPVSIIESLLKK